MLWVVIACAVRDAATDSGGSECGVREHRQEDDHVRRQLRGRNQEEGVCGVGCAQDHGDGFAGSDGEVLDPAEQRRTHRVASLRHEEAGCLIGDDPGARLAAGTGFAGTDPRAQGEHGHTAAEEDTVGCGTEVRTRFDREAAITFVFDERVEEAVRRVREVQTVHVRVVLADGQVQAGAELGIRDDRPVTDLRARDPAHLLPEPGSARRDLLQEAVLGIHFDGEGPATGTGRRGRDQEVLDQGEGTDGQGHTVPGA